VSQFEEAFAAVGRLFDEAIKPEAGKAPAKKAGAKKAGAKKKAAAKKDEPAEPTAQDVRDALMRVVEVEGPKAALQILKPFDCKKVTQLSKAKYAPVIEAAEAYMDALEVDDDDDDDDEDEEESALD
jgi:hypothetical protein